MERSHRSSTRDPRALSNRILERAGSGISRAQFLKEVSEMTLAFTGCDVVRMVLRDGGRRYFCELNASQDQPFLFDTAGGSDQTGAEITWSCGHNESVEKLCRAIILGKTDPSQPWFMASGSFWTGEMGSVPFLKPDPPDTAHGTGLSVNASVRSLAFIPIEVGHDRIGLIQLTSEQGNLCDRDMVDEFERLVQTLGIGLTHRRLQVALRERVKELTCLYGIAKLAAQPGLSLEVVLQRTAELLPPAWLYPESAFGRIELDGRTFATADDRKSVQSMRADIVVRAETRGFVEVGYLREKPPLDEGPFLSEERHLIDTIARDVSIIVERKQGEDEKLRLQEQLLQADRLATVGQLGASVAHELNEPLASILGFAQLAVKDPELSRQTLRDLDKIVSSTLHARNVISKLLTFARQTAPEKSRLQLNALVEDGVQFLQSRCTKAGIDLSCRLAPDLPEITADRSQLLQVLINLLVNSIQAMPDGGRLIIATTHEDGHVILSVEDTGVGMTEDVIKKIYDPFFTTKDVDQGTGLGLAVVHSIVVSHGGTIQVSSEAGRGTRFEVQLPVGDSDKSKESNHG